MNKHLQKLMLPVFALILTTGAHAQKIITTIAGTGGTGFGGDNTAATLAKIDGPSGVAADDSGRIYIVDKNNARIRRISKTGVITTIAGNGTFGYNGDHIAATAAEIYPKGIAVDLAGNVFIADQGNNCVRKISASGIITTVAGDTTAGFLGDGGAATAAELSGPSAIAIDASGNLFIADQGNNRIRKVSAGTITTVAGGGTSGLGDGGAATAASLSFPTGVAVDAGGNFFIVDQGNNRIRKVTGIGMISTYAGTGAVGWTGDGGAAIAATFNYPVGIAIDDSENVYVAEGNNNVIRKIDAIGNIYTVAGNNVIGFIGDGGAATAAKLDNPTGVAVDTSGKIYIADLGNNRIRKVASVSHAGVPQTVALNGNITLMPNPNNGIFTVKGPLNSLTDDKVNLRVTDMLGKVVYNDILPAQKGVINTQILLTNVPDGMYILHMQSGTETYVSRFVIGK